MLVYNLHYPIDEKAIWIFTIELKFNTYFAQMFLLFQDENGKSEINVSVFIFRVRMRCNDIDGELGVGSDILLECRAGCS